jgi:hypothetical protein
MFFRAIFAAHPIFVLKSVNHCATYTQLGRWKTLRLPIVVAYMAHLLRTMPFSRDRAIENSHMVRLKSRSSLTE